MRGNAVVDLVDDKLDVEADVAFGDRAVADFVLDKEEEVVLLLLVLFVLFARRGVESADLGVLDLGVLDLGVPDLGVAGCDLERWPKHEEVRKMVRGLKVEELFGVILNQG